MGSLLPDSREMSKSSASRDMSAMKHDHITEEATKLNAHTRASISLDNVMATRMSMLAHRRAQQFTIMRSVDVPSSTPCVAVAPCKADMLGTRVGTTSASATERRRATAFAMRTCGVGGG